MSDRDPFRHVILLMLENRSFDQMLGDLTHFNPAIDGIDRGNPNANDDAPRPPIAQHPGAAFSLDKAAFGAAHDIDFGHDYANVKTQLDLGAPSPTMSGFVKDFRSTNPNGTIDALARQVMAYFDAGVAGADDALPVLHTLAKSFLICDRWFSSLPGPTWPNRLFALTGTSEGYTAMPDFSHPFAAPLSYGQDTIFDRFADRGLTARTYAEGVTMTWILRKMWFHPSRRRKLADLLADAAGEEVNFPAFSFVEPSYSGSKASDQHPPYDVRNGERLIATVYNALLKNPALWQSTLLIVTYDEHGGFYDHAPPPRTISPGDPSHDEFNFDRLGVRVPAVLISPWLQAGVCSTTFDHTSVLRYLADTWDLPPLGQRAAQATSIRAAFAGQPWVLRTDTPGPFVVPDAITAGQASVGSSVYALAKAMQNVELSAPGAVSVTRDLTPPPTDAEAMQAYLLARTRELDAVAMQLEKPRHIKVFAVHGVGHGDAKNDWQNQWRKAIIDQVRAQPGCGDFTVQVEFARYDDLFNKYPLDAQTIAEAILRFGGGLVSGPEPAVHRDLLRPLSSIHDELRWTAGMAAQWVDYRELRNEVRMDVQGQLERFGPDLIVAHSLGCMIMYDLIRRQVVAGQAAQFDQTYLFTFGSQLANAAVLPVFDGRIEPLNDGTHGIARWFNFYNKHDVVFTCPLPYVDARTSTLETDFNGLTNGTFDLLSHDGASYLAHPGTMPAWRAAVTTGNAIACSVAAPAAAPSTADAPARIVATRPTTRRALLVGINTYGHIDQPLDGCVNDVYLLSSVLQEYGFAADDIRIVTDEHATRAGLTDRLDWLMDGARQNDTRMFYYSGHGTLIPAYGADAAPDHLDESLVPYDFDWTADRAFTDRDFRRFYSQLPYGVRFLAGFDCCHAAGMGRGPARARGIDLPDDVRHRALRWDKDLQMWVPREWVPPPRRGYSLSGAQGSSDDPADKASLRPLGESRLIRSPAAQATAARADYGHEGPYMPLMLFACQRSEVASEYAHGSVSYGAFSFTLAKMFRARCGSIATMDALPQVVADARQLMQDLGYNQTPELVGPKQRKSASALL